MTQAAPNREEALQLMEFLVSPEAQTVYAEENHEYPVLPGAEIPELVASWGTLDADTLPLDEVAEHRADALRIMEEVNFDG
jgi:iron(III) transport system substrate-binding protein